MTFNTRFENSVRLTIRSPNRVSCERSAHTDTGNRMLGQHRSPVRGTSKSVASEVARNAQTKAAFKCDEWEGIGYLARECSTRLRTEANPSNAPGMRNPSERSRRSQSPGNNLQGANKSTVRSITNGQKTDSEV
jgi:hypothetical protein